ncbi:MAG: beta-lactamase family protein [Actinobacteria bacterium]|nr:beta-lactamase family protein [Actinomycetota bacterium]
MSIQLNRRVAVMLFTALATLAGPAVGPAQAANAGAAPTGAQRCNDPSGREDFARLSPAEAKLDAAALQELLDWAGSRSSASVRVYRHGCLVGTSRMDALTQDLPTSWNSSTKSVVALTVGRAIQLGLVSLSDPVRRFFPEADEAHGRILLRHLITMSGGLRSSASGDAFNDPYTDSVRLALHQEVVHPPGAYFEYEQRGLTLLLACVQKAVGGDVQDFMQRELFGQLGIERDEWFWLRDRAGWTAGWAGLVLSPRLMPRFAHLMLNGGVWNGERLLPAGFVEAAQSSNPVNGGYGYLMWTNQGNSYYTSTIPGRRLVERPILPSAPRDLYAFAGLAGQYLYVIPSLDMIIERSGDYPSRDKDTTGSEGSRADGEFGWELFRMLDRTVTDAHWPDPGPYQPLDPAPVDAYAIVHPGQTLDVLGVGPRAGGCNPAGCDGKVDVSGYQQMGGEAIPYAVEIAHQVQPRAGAAGAISGWGLGAKPMK